MATILWITASSAFLHTLLGVDHSLPFVALARSRSWSITKTLVVTAICGLIHVLGTLLLCLTALALGQTLGVVESIESFRADFAAIFLLAFGLFSLLRSMNGNTQAAALGKHPTDFWILFLFFAFGPCEFLLPILAIEELSQSWLSFSATVAVFTTITLTTMLMTVALGMKGLDILPWTLNHRRASVLSGLAITGCGLSLLIFGL